MATLNCFDTLQLLTCGLRFLVKDTSTGKTIIQTVPKPVKKSKAENGVADDEEGRSSKGEDDQQISSSSISPCGSYIALCDDHKQLTLWKVRREDSGLVELLYQQELVRRASKVIFSRDSKHLLVADKNGDVYLFESEKKPDECGKLLLGHLSMLLDILMSRDGRFVLTADRDEKVRVSRFPNSYNIHNFCLGHREFVTSITFISSKQEPQDLLVSGSGDGTVKVWRFLEGREVASREVFRDVELDIGTITEEMEVEGEVDKSGLTPRVEPPPQPAVVSVQGVGKDLVLVQVERFRGLCLYSFKEGQLALQEVLHLTSILLDYDFLPSSASLLLLLKEGSCVKIETYSVKNESLVKESSCPVDDQEGFFSSLKEHKEGLESLHKRWFDNVKDYMQRKEARIEKSENKPPPVKKPKS